MPDTRSAACKLYLIHTTTPLGGGHLPSLTVRRGNADSDLPRLTQLMGSGAGFELVSDSEIYALFRKTDHLTQDPLFTLS